MQNKKPENFLQRHGEGFGILIWITIFIIIIIWTGNIPAVAPSSYGQQAGDYTQQ